MQRLDDEIAGKGRAAGKRKSQRTERFKTMVIMENIQNSQVVRAYRQGWLAWLGAHKTAYDLAQDGVQKLMNGREELVDELVQKGEEVETFAQDNIKKARGYVEPRLNEVNEKVSGISSKVFARSTEEATDRVADLSEEVAKLTKTVSALSRKVNTVAKPAAKKAAPKRATKTTAKKAVPAKKAAAVKTEATPAVEAKTAA
jgi:polyhydroxyalkanoate synthesis regulator phasin